MLLSYLDTDIGGDDASTGAYAGEDVGQSCLFSLSSRSYHLKQNNEFSLRLHPDRLDLNISALLCVRDTLKAVTGELHIVVEYSAPVRLTLTYRGSSHRYRHQSVLWLNKHWKTTLAVKSGWILWHDIAIPVQFSCVWWITIGDFLFWASQWSCGTTSGSGANCTTRTTSRSVVVPVRSRSRLMRMSTCMGQPLTQKIISKQRTALFAPGSGPSRVLLPTGKYTTATSH